MELSAWGLECFEVACEEDWGFWLMILRGIWRFLYLSAYTNFTTWIGIKSSKFTSSHALSMKGNWKGVFAIKDFRLLVFTSILKHQKLARGCWIKGFYHHHSANSCFLRLSIYLLKGIWVSQKEKETARRKKNKWLKKFYDGKILGAWISSMSSSQLLFDSSDHRYLRILDSYQRSRYLWILHPYLMEWVLVNPPCLLPDGAWVPVIPRYLLPDGVSVLVKYLGKLCSSKRKKEKKKLDIGNCKGGWGCRYSQCLSANSCLARRITGTWVSTREINASKKKKSYERKFADENRA